MVKGGMRYQVSLFAKKTCELINDLDFIPFEFNGILISECTNEKSYSQHRQMEFGFFLKKFSSHKKFFFLEGKLGFLDWEENFSQWWRGGEGNWKKILMMV